MIRAQGGNLVLLEGCAQYPGQFAVGYSVEQQSFSIHHQVQLVAEGGTLRWQTCLLHDAPLQLLQFSRIRHLRTKRVMQLSYHIGFACLKQLLKDVLWWREADHGLRIPLLHRSLQGLLQRRDGRSLFRLEVELRLGGGERVVSV